MKRRKQGFSPLLYGEIQFLGNDGAVVEAFRIEMPRTSNGNSILTTLKEAAQEILRDHGPFDGVLLVNATVSGRLYTDILAGVDIGEISPEVSVA